MAADLMQDRRGRRGDPATRFARSGASERALGATFLTHLEAVFEKGGQRMLKPVAPKSVRRRRSGRWKKRLSTIAAGRSSAFTLPALLTLALAFLSNPVEPEVGGGAGDVRASERRATLIKTAQYYRFDDQNYCWYAEGLQGPGWSLVRGSVGHWRRLGRPQRLEWLGRRPPTLAERPARHWDLALAAGQKRPTRQTRSWTRRQRRRRSSCLPQRRRGFAKRSPRRRAGFS